MAWAYDAYLVLALKFLSFIHVYPITEILEFLKLPWGPGKPVATILKV